MQEIVALNPYSNGEMNYYAHIYLALVKKERERILTMKIKFLTRNKTDVLHQMTCDFATFSRLNLR